MPRTNGVYLLPSPPCPFIPDTPANAEDQNTVLDDIAQALTDSMAADGSTPWNGPVNFNSQNVGGINNLTVAGSITSASMSTSLLSASSMSLNSIATSVNMVGNSLSNVGNLSVVGTITGVNENLSGSLSVNGNINTTNVTCNGLWANTEAWIAALGQQLNANNQNIVNVALLTAGTIDVTTLNVSNFNLSGAFSVGGDFDVGGSLRVNNNNVVLTQYGIQFPGVGGDIFNWRWDGTQMYMRVDNAVEWPLVEGDGSYRVHFLGMSGSQMYWHDSDQSTWYANTFRSDPRVKDQIAPSPVYNSLQAIANTNTYSYRRIDITPPEQVSFGFLGNELEAALPDSVRLLPVKEGETNYYHLNLEGMMAHAYRAIKQLAAQMEALEARLT